MITGESSGSGSEEELVRSGGELPSYMQQHQAPQECDEQQLGDGMGEEPMPSDPEDMVVSGDEDMDEPEPDTDVDVGGKRLEQVRRHRQDAENNNSLEDGEPGTPLVPQVPFPFPAASHVTLEALQNTKVAVAQFAATTMANNADNEAALQELAVLQSTLFTLQHQQVFQLQLIQQLQNQLSLNRQTDSGPVTPPAVSVAPPPRIPIPRLPTPSPPKTQIPTREPTPVRFEPPTTLPASQAVPPSHPQPPQVKQELISIPKPPAVSPPMLPNHIPYSSISSSLASTIITNNDPPPSLNEPNTLEMLQKRAQEVLDNASQGLLANNLADELAFRKSGKMSPYDGKSGGRNEPFFKHRCRYCGKVFGSDSALQIHIRSHTGERPFKCNVCGSRFTTKGNLKVHFQRHTAKFPHVKMNPNPIPEHLDKYHPPLLAQLSPGPMPGMPPHHPLPFPAGAPPPFPAAALPLYRPLPPRSLSDKPLHPLFAMRDEQDLPADLSKPTSATPTSPLRIPSEERFKKEPAEDEQQQQQHHQRSFEDNDRVVTPKQEPDTDRESPGVDAERYPASPYDECSMDSKYSSEDMMQGQEDSPNEKHDPDQPENLSSKIHGPFSVVKATPSSVAAVVTSVAAASLSTTPFLANVSSPPSSASSGSLSMFHTSGLPGMIDVDPTKDPIIYNSLLPRPGSNDNSWESLIEVTKTSETSKLQQLVDNIEHKLTDPNQCVICQRVLSCKSALQMHYRTHTGERPFRCRICGRAFTTKGNLKTHMGVHRMKPPMRVLHQCPVCHKKFTNALVLQQHIRLHTGEPTDLTPEQIQAAEIKDAPPHPFLPQGFPGAGQLPGFRESDQDSKDEDFSSDGYAMEHDDFDDDSTNNEEMPSFTASLAALENQVRTMTAPASPDSSYQRSSPREAASTSPPPIHHQQQLAPQLSPLVGLSLLGAPGARSPLGGAPFSPLGLPLGPAGTPPRAPAHPTDLFGACGALADTTRPDGVGSPQT